MKNTNFSTVAARVIDGFETTAERAVGAWRDGGERLGEFAGAQWDSAFAQSRAKLSAETRRNATQARKVFAGYYTRGVDLSASGAEVAAHALAQAARVAVDRAAAWQQART